MIVLRLEMWPKGDAKRARPLGLATISNAGGTASRGDYEVRLFKSPEYSPALRKTVRPIGEMLTRPLSRETWKIGTVKDFPRLRLGPWDLLLRALVATVAGRNVMATVAAGNAEMDSEAHSAACVERQEMVGGCHPLCEHESLPCTCAKIQEADSRRHFRECPRRVELPELPREGVAAQEEHEPVT